MVISRSVAGGILALAFFSFTAGAISQAEAQSQDYWSMSCGDLWYRRNEIFSTNGYCFKTDRALRVFGNANCRFDVEADVPMSRAEREEVDIIKSVERRKGC